MGLTRTPRKRCPPNNPDYLAYDKTSAFCPKCRGYVSKDGVECLQCMAFWHYECANVTGEVLEAEWENQDFLCPMHQPPRSSLGTGREVVKASVSLIQQENEKNSGHFQNNNNLSPEPETVITTFRVTSYTLNPTASLKKLQKFLARNLQIECKDKGKQFKVYLNTATYHLLLSNVAVLGESLGIQVADNNIDQSGKHVSSQFNIDLDEITRATMIFYHTSCTMLVQLKGAEDATWQHKLQLVDIFVYRFLSTVVHEIERSTN